MALMLMSTGWVNAATVFVMAALPAIVLLQRLA